MSRKRGSNWERKQARKHFLPRLIRAIDVNCSIRERVSGNRVAGPVTRKFLVYRQLPANVALIIYDADKAAGERRGTLKNFTFIAGLSSLRD